MIKEKKKCNPDIHATKRRTISYHRPRNEKNILIGDCLETPLPSKGDKPNNDRKENRGKIAQPDNVRKGRISND